MTHSMTAFARASGEHTNGQLTWEIRSVNSRYLELHFRLPDNFRELEPQLREQLKKHLNRGKVECALRFQAQEAHADIEVNEPLVQQLNQAADKIHAIIGPGNAMNVLELMRFPGVLDSAPVDNKALQQVALTAFTESIEQLQQARAREGASLQQLIQQRLGQMNTHVEQVKQDYPQALQKQKQQLHDKLSELSDKLDNDRLEQEMVLATQKSDIAEELDRLDTHIQEVGNILQRPEPIGRRLDFMMQELNREANTLSSKSLTTGITQAAVELKVLIEQMREQVQNIE